MHQLFEVFFIALLAFFVLYALFRWMKRPIVEKLDKYAPFLLFGGGVLAAIALAWNAAKKKALAPPTRLPDRSPAIEPEAVKNTDIEISETTQKLLEIDEKMEEVYDEILSESGFSTELAADLFGSEVTRAKKDSPE